MSPCQSDINGAEHGKYIGLDKGNQALQRIQEHAEENGYERHAACQERAVLGHDEDDAHHRQDHNVARQHIGKQTDGEGDRFHKGTEDLDHRHNGFEEARNVRGKNLFIIMLRSVTGTVKKNISVHKNS